MTFEAFTGPPTQAEPHGHKLALQSIQVLPGHEHELFYDTSPILIRTLEIHQLDDLTLAGGHPMSHWTAARTDIGIEWRWAKTSDESCVLEYRDTRAATITYFNAEITYVAPGETFTSPANERTAVRESGSGVTARGTDRQTIQSGCAYVKSVRVLSANRR